MFRIDFDASFLKSYEPHQTKLAGMQKTEAVADLIFTLGVFIWRRAGPPWRDPATLVIPPIKTFCGYMVRGLALKGEISPLTARDLTQKD